MLTLAASVIVVERLSTVTTYPSQDRPVPDLSERTYRLLVDNEEDHGCGELPEDVCREVPSNALKLVGALTLQKIGDRVVDPKTVLTWLFEALGASAALIGMLVPVREAGSLLPQATLVPVVRRVARRKWVWIAGAAGMAVAVAVMAFAAAFATGTGAALIILGALAAFALSRSLTSIASKDVLGRTVAKGQRGQVTGAASMTSGVVAITFGLAIRIWGGDAVDPAIYAWLLAGAASMWVLALATFATVEEPQGEHDESLDAGRITDAVRLLRDDWPFRRFVIARTLLLVSALTPPFVVSLATADAEVDLAGLGPFVIAQGLASMIGGRVWGRFADRSSRRVIMMTAGMASIVVLGFLGARLFDTVADAAITYSLTYFVLALIHTGARIGRKTYVVDLAEGNRRTDYVAVANTAMGVLLLVTGAISAGLASLGAEVALIFLAVLGLVAIPVGRTLPEVSAGAS